MQFNVHYALLQTSVKPANLLTNYKFKELHADKYSLKELAVLQSTYGEIARHVIWGVSTTRHITDWLVTCNTTEILIR